MDSLDSVLMRVAHAPVPASVEEIDVRVLARIAAQPAMRLGMGVGGMTIAIALMMGMVGASVPAQEASTASLTPLAPVSSLAPSSLLLGGS